MNRIKKILILLLCTHTHQLLFGTPEKRIITVPIANLRITPHAAPTTQAPALSDDMGGREHGQITQLLFNETIITEQDKHASNGWLLAEAQEQKDVFGDPIPKGYVQIEQTTPVELFPTNTLIVKDIVVEVAAQHLEDPTNVKTFMLPIGSYLSGRIQCNDQWLVVFPDLYIGMVPAASVYEINKLVGLSEQEKRDSLVEAAKKFLSTKFVWGGRSIHIPKITDTIMGVDISGFINLVHRVININVPKHSKHLFITGQKNAIAHGSMLKPGDIIFLVRQPNFHPTPTIYIGNNEIIYVTGNPTGKDFSNKQAYSPEEQEMLSVQISPLSHFFTTPLETLSNGDIPQWVNPEQFKSGSSVYFGSFITTP